MEFGFYGAFVRVGVNVLSSRNTAFCVVVDFYENTNTKIKNVDFVFRVLLIG